MLDSLLGIISIADNHVTDSVFSPFDIKYYLIYLQLSKEER